MQARPRLESAWFAIFQPNEEKLAFNLLSTLTWFMSLHPYTAAARGRSVGLAISAVSGRRETRLGSLLTTLPQRIELYFNRRKGRKLLWKGICCFSGFYVANTLTLTFGALGKAVGASFFDPQLETISGIQNFKT